ncbi:reverse transcriptase domain-containing protein [Dongia sp.]|uniref:reverse transcriptase domain-containing protein n=1 Tax=Dongia sp. TaxID=1977262 RepID=UPI0037527D44
MNYPAYPRPIRIASIQNLRRVWESSKDAHGRGGAPGVDGVTPRAFRSNLDPNIEAVQDRVLTQPFVFSKLRPVPLLKASGKIRIICVPTLADRLVQRLFVDYLVTGDKLRVKNSVSFGFVRGGGGVARAIKKAKNLRAEFPWAFKSDIASFFDEIDREDLKANLEKQFHRSSSLPFLQAAIDCEVDTSNKYKAAQIAAAGLKPGVGLRQGMPLSPLLSNFVLRDFDRLFELHGARLVRYADDFVLFAKTEDECRSFFPMVRSQLAKKNHTIPDISPGSKTAIYAPAEPVEFLGFEIKKTASANSYRVVAPAAAFKAIKASLDEFSDLDHAIATYKNLARTVQSANATMAGFLGAYQPAKNFDDLKSHAGNCRAETFRRLLSTLFGAPAIAQLDDRKREFVELKGLLDASVVDAQDEVMTS